ncbi:MAG: glycosyltransferase family 4 protein [Rhodothermales bacterium]
MKKVIGTNTIGYPEIRNFTGLPFSRYRVLKKQNLYKIPAYLYFKFKNNTHQYFWNTFNDMDFHNVELFHFFNGLSVGKTPWVTTFETVLPRWGNDKLIRKGLELVARDSCKKIIAISACTANLQKKLVQDKYPELEHEIEEKLMVLHPAQKKIISSYDDKKLDSEYIVFAMVGNQIFSKGGREVIAVLSEFVKKGYPVKLNLVSNLSSDNYATMTSEKDIVVMKGLIEGNKHYINHYCNISNIEVIELLKESHVALLPTYADTYGYFVLEAQAAGCPVVTTNIRALPEINNNEIGWMIKVPLDEESNGVLVSTLDRKIFSKAISDQLYPIIEEIISSRELIKEKGIRSLLKIDAVHSVGENVAVLESLYDEVSNVKTLAKV